MIRKIYRILFSEDLRISIRQKLIIPGNNLFRKIIGQQAKDVFEDIYIANSWGSEESVSGSGSEISKTIDLIKYLNELLREYNIESVFDIPCGDFNWMKEVDLTNVKYTGGDIVPNLIHRNQTKYNMDWISFSCHNLISDKIDKSYDLVLTRDCLVHLSYSDIERSLTNIKKSQSKYLLTTSFIKTTKNMDIVTGEWRPINLNLAPFNFPEPIKTFIETNTEEGWEGNKVMNLYVISEIRI
jgi:hypothetical protein